MTMIGGGESSGAPTFNIVLPGSPDDPFSALANGQVAPAAPGTMQTPGNGSEPAKPQAPQAPAAVPANPATTPNATGVALTAEDVQKQIQEAQRGWDRRISAQQATILELQKQRDDAREDAIKRERAAIESKLDPTQLAQQHNIWAAEDRVRDLEKKEGAVLDMYRAVEGLRLLETYKGHGITEDDLLGFKGDPTTMEDYVKSVAFERVTGTGKAPASADDGKGKAPAGAGASQDKGGMPAAPQAPQVYTTQGVASMAGNIKGMFS